MESIAVIVVLGLGLYLLAVSLGWQSDYARAGFRWKTKKRLWKGGVAAVLILTIVGYLMSEGFM